MGDGLGAGDPAPVLGGDVEAIEAGSPSLLDLARLGDQRRVRHRAGEVVDGHTQRNGVPPVGVARRAEGDVGQGEDDAAVGLALKVDHVCLQLQAYFAMAAAQVEEFDAQRLGPRIVFDALAQCWRDRPSVTHGGQHNSRWQRGCYFDIGMSRLGATMILLALLVSACATMREASSTPQPAAVPRSAVLPVASPAMTLGPEQRVVAYPNGRWLLYGDGTVAAPYAWVWIPAGTTPPPSSPPAR